MELCEHTSTYACAKRQWLSCSRIGSDYFTNQDYKAWVLISIHAPAWGATLTTAFRQVIYKYFNSRSRMGSDAKAMTTSCEYKISTHAPAQGATGLAGVELFASEVTSIHAPAQGATRKTGN